MLVHLLIAAFLGAVQGVTEFLPVSSTAHLIICENFFRLDPKQYGLNFDMVTNLGTLLATLIYFRHDLITIFRRLRFATPARPLSMEERLPWTIILATIPAGVMGLLLHRVIETSLRTIPVIAASLLLVGLLMMGVERWFRHNQDSEPDTAQVLGMGLAQCLALVPGVSRSGITITAAMMGGLGRVTAAHYSFLLSVPITAAATLYQCAKFANHIRQHSIEPEVAAFYGVGLLVSLVVGYLTITFLLGFYRRHSLTSFAVYRIVLAVALMLGLLSGRLTLHTQPEELAQGSPRPAHRVATTSASAPPRLSEPRR